MSFGGEIRRSALDRKTKREMQTRYKEREIVGGVYVVKNTLKNKLLIEADTDVYGSKNRFEFAFKTGSCVLPRLQNDWTEQNGRHFVFEILEELKKGETQSLSEFKSDIGIMKQIWLEKMADEDLY